MKWAATLDVPPLPMVTPPDPPRNRALSSGRMLPLVGSHPLTASLMIASIVVPEKPSSRNLCSFFRLQSSRSNFFFSPPPDLNQKFGW